MPAALEAHRLVKRFTVGIGGCLATAAVLRGVDLSVRGGELVAVVGDRGAGKSTLFLCLAGLLAPDSGQVSWFGDPTRAAGFRRTLYHVAPTDLLRTGRSDQCCVHLVDIGQRADSLELANWIAARRESGHAILIAARDEEWLHALGSRVVRLRRGELHPVSPRPLIRVAEPVHH